MRRLATISLSCLVLAACAVGPTYKTPAIASQTGKPFVEGGAGGMLSGRALPADWWRLFDDPALNRLIKDAFAYNADIAKAQADLRQARAIVLEQKSGLLPTTTLDTQYSRNRLGVDSITPPQAAAAYGSTGAGGPSGFDYNAFQTGFDVSYEVDLFGRVRRSIEAARRDEQASAAALDGVRISIAAEVAQAYAEACGGAQQADVARETAELEGRTLALTQRLLDEGRGTRRDVDQASVLVEEALAQVPHLEAERRAQLYALAALTGRTPRDIDQAAKACRQAPTVAMDIPVGDGATLLARRPDVRQAERRLAGDTARIGVATAALYPTVSLLGSVSAAGTRSGQVGTSKAFDYSFGPFITWSFPNMVVARARIAGADAAAQGSWANFQGTVLTALKETESALARYGAAREQRASLSRAAAAASDAADLTQQRFTAGRDNFLQLLVAEQNRAFARTALAQADTVVADNAVGVFKALGGGWEGAPASILNGSTKDRTIGTAN